MGIMSYFDTHVSVPRGMSEVKRFNNEIYHTSGGNTNKADAMARAKDARVKGNKARVVKIGGVYWVYRRRA